MTDTSLINNGPLPDAAEAGAADAGTGVRVMLRFMRGFRRP